jgi:Meckel syndrome type 1 protein
VSAAAVAAVEVPRRATERRSSRSQTQRAALRANRQAELPAAAASAAATQTAVADAVAPKPFQPQHVEPASRPWPRAVLPQYSGNGAMTASFDTSSPTSPSFYPFEPQTAPASADAPVDREPLH